jgi:hypothetical protein
MSGMPMQASAQSVAAQNLSARAFLIQNGIRMSQQVQLAFALTLGTASRINLLRTGITTGVMLNFTSVMNISATATASLFGPWNLINSVIYTDFSGVQRVRTDGLGLYSLTSAKHQQLMSNPVTGAISTIGNIDTDILSVPTAILNPTTMYFSLYVPMAVDPSSDLSGAVPSLTNVGEHYLTITPTAAYVNASDTMQSPYSAGTIVAAGAGITVDVTQFYINPPSLTAATIPGVDLTTIYEINGLNDTTSGFTSNSQNLIAYPNDRSIKSALHVFQNGGVPTLNGADLTKLELLVNSNTVFRQLSPRLFRELMRNEMQGDLPSGVYYWTHRQQPILTSIYATVQARYSLGTINAGTTRIRAQYESVYPSGQPLSGITANAG